MIRVGIFSTHPIQYQTPWFQALNDVAELNVTVYYQYLPDADQQGAGFGRAFSWDLPLLDGYRWKAHNGRDVPRDNRCSVLQAVRSSQIVLVTGWQNSHLRWATVLAYLRRRPIIIRGESSALKTRPDLKIILQRLYLKIPNQFLTIGQANARFYRQNGVPDSRMHACPYFVENERFDRDYQRLSGERDKLRSMYNISDQAVCFLFAGKFVTKKRPLDVLRAVVHLSDLHDRIHVLMVGSGSLLQTARAYAQQKQLPATFTGFLNQTEIASAYTAADVSVLPSDFDETWGLVVNEGMIFENPAIVSDRVGCGPDLVSEGSTGFSFPFGNIRELAAVMRHLIECPAERSEMGRRARKLVLNEYSVEKAVEGTLSAIRAGRTSVESALA